MGFLSDIKDFIFGKNEPSRAESVSKLDPLQRELLERLISGVTDDHINSALSPNELIAEAAAGVIPTATGFNMFEQLSPFLDDYYNRRDPATEWLFSGLPMAKEMRQEALIGGQERLDDLFKRGWEFGVGERDESIRHGRDFLDDLLYKGWEYGTGARKSALTEASRASQEFVESLPNFEELFSRARTDYMGERARALSELRGQRADEGNTLEEYLAGLATILDPSQFTDSGGGVVPGGGNSYWSTDAAARGGVGGSGKLEAAKALAGLQTQGATALEQLRQYGDLMQLSQSLSSLGPLVGMYSNLGNQYLQAGTAQLEAALRQQELATSSIGPLLQFLTGVGATQAQQMGSELSSIGDLLQHTQAFGALQGQHTTQALESIEPLLQFMNDATQTATNSLVPPLQAGIEAGKTQAAYLPTIPGTLEGLRGLGEDEQTWNKLMQLLNPTNEVVGFQGYHQEGILGDAINAFIGGL